MEVAPSFVDAKEPIISPSATSGETSVLSGKSYVWRTVQSDVAQAKTMLLLAKRSGAEKIGLITSSDAYGTTFFDWIGFFATEVGLEVTGLIRTSGTGPCDPFVAQVLEPKPDVLFVVPSQSDEALCIARAARALSPATRLFSDAGVFPDFIQALGPLAEGIEGTAPAPDPTSGFEVAFGVLYGHSPPPYGANVYDALTLAAFGLERSHGEGGPALAKALEEVVDGRGAPMRDRRRGGRDLARPRKG